MTNTLSQTSPKYPRPLIITLFALTVLVPLSFVFTLGLDAPISGDEIHFIPTVQQFASTPLSLDFLQTYEEMSTPLPFWLYAQWSHLAGTEAHQLRIFSLILSALTSALFLYILIKENLNPKTLTLLFLLWLLHPYTLYLTPYVYTDMLAFLATLALYLAIRRNNLILIALATAGMLLSRQYLAFIILAAGIYYLLQVFPKPNLKKFIAITPNILALFLGSLPFFLLVLLWQSLSPQNEMKNLYVKYAFTYNITSLFVYLITAAVYLSPLMFLRAKTFFTKPALITAACFTPLYYFFPVTPSQCSINVDILTVGLFHRALDAFLPIPAQHAVFTLAFFLSIILAYHILTHTTQLLRHLSTTSPTPITFILLTAICFALIMPLSYLHWEKYFMPIYPLLIIWAATYSSNRNSNSSPTPTTSTTPVHCNN